MLQEVNNNHLNTSNSPNGLKMVTIPFSYVEERTISSCENGNIHELWFLLQYIPGRALHFTRSDYNPLLTAVFCRQNMAVKMLLEHGLETDPQDKMASGPIINVHSIQNKHHSTALHVAAYRWNLGAMHLILNHCREKGTLSELLNAQDAWGKTCLHQAVYHNFFHGVALLLSFSEMDRTVQDTSSRVASDYCLYNKPNIQKLFKNELDA